MMTREPDRLGAGGATVLIRGGTVVSPHDSFPADVLLSGGRVVAVAERIDERADDVVDARGCLVLPGGVDAHTHIDFAPGPFRTCDTFTSGTSAAALGGTTCVLDFALQDPSAPLADAVEERLADVRRHPPVVDVGLHLILRAAPRGDWTAELRSVLDRGVADFKLFLAHRHEVMIEDDLAYRLLTHIAAADALAMVHAENGYVIDALRDDLAGAGCRGPAGHGRSRPRETEVDAVFRTVQFCRLTGARAYLVHLSSAESVQIVAEARASGVDISAETCPQYLVLDESVLDDSERGWQYLFAPPPRGEGDRAALWRGLATGAVATVASDHSPYLSADKAGERHADFRSVPNGIAGVEERLSLLYEFGVRAGRLTVNRLVDVFSTSPARIFGLTGKGQVRAGADADLVVFDPTQPHRISAASGGSACDFSAYEGTTVGGSVDTVFVRGQKVVAQGRRTDLAGTGRYVPRSGGHR